MMKVPPLPLLVSSPPTQVAASAKLSDQANEMLLASNKPEQFLENLIEARRFKDAYSYLAAVLPLREAAWWAGLCIRQSHGPGIRGNDRIALRAAISWVLNPTMERRHHAELAALACGKSSACGCLALAVGQTTATPARSTTSPTMVPRYLRRAILLASVHGDSRILHHYPENFVRLGIGIAAGTEHWRTLVKAAPPPK